MTLRYYQYAQDKGLSLRCEPPGKGSSFSILATVLLALRSSKMQPLNFQ